jgi:endonuclease/exonuclease/phosphatase family metal-dependent hydrolase
MKILSWNILADEFIKERYYPMIPPELLLKRQHRQKQILTLLKHIQTDVMLLQEVMPAEYKLLVAAFKKTHHILRGKYITWQQKPSHSGNVTLLSKELFTLSAKPITDLKFGLIVQCEYQSQPLLLINIHLDDVSQPKRLSQLEELVPLIQTHEKIIMGGDFNDNYNTDKPSAVYKLIKNSGLKIFNHKPTYYVGRPLCIDHILTKGLLFKNKTAQVVNDFKADIVQEYNVYGSDHLPVILY